MFKETEVSSSFLAADMLVTKSGHDSDLCGGQLLEVDLGKDEPIRGDVSGIDLPGVSREDAGKLAVAGLDIGVLRYVIKEHRVESDWFRAGGLGAADCAWSSLVCWPVEVSAADGFDDVGSSGGGNGAGRSLGSDGGWRR